MDRVMQAYEERRANKRPGIIRTLLSAVIPSGPSKQAMVTQQQTQGYASQPVNAQNQQYVSNATPPYTASPLPYQQASSNQQEPPQYYSGSAQYQQPPHY